MANTLISYKGANCWLNNDSTTDTYLMTSATDIYLNANISNMFNRCKNLKLNLDTLNWKYDLVKNLANTYDGCWNLTGSPVCGPNVIDMSGTYNCCSNITGSPVCGNNVTNMANAYYDCGNLTGSPVCGNNVTNMANVYDRCWNLTG